MKCTHPRLEPRAAGDRARRKSFLIVESALFANSPDLVHDPRDVFALLLQLHGLKIERDDHDPDPDTCGDQMRRCPLRGAFDVDRIIDTPIRSRADPGDEQDRQHTADGERKIAPLVALSLFGKGTIQGIRFDNLAAPAARADEVRDRHAVHKEDKDRHADGEQPMIDECRHALVAPRFDFQILGLVARFLGHFRSFRHKYHAAAERCGAQRSP